MYFYLAFVHVQCFCEIVSETILKGFREGIGGQIFHVEDGAHAVLWPSLRTRASFVFSSIAASQVHHGELVIVFVFTALVVVVVIVPAYCHRSFR